jgi:type IV secretory pathway VirD2 relaxase
LLQAFSDVKLQKKKKKKKISKNDKIHGHFKSNSFDLISTILTMVDIKNILRTLAGHVNVASTDHN